MKRLLILIIVLALGWSGYWMFGAWGVRSGWAGWISAQRDAGWVAGAADVSVRGFPNRFDTTFTDLTLADPKTGIAWKAPFFQVFALSYQPNHVIAVWPHTQTVSTPLQTIDVAAGDMRASAVVGAAISVPIERLNLVVSDVSLASSAGWHSAADTFRLALRTEGPALNSYRLAVEATGFAPPAALGLGSTTALPQTFDILRADVLAQFDAPWDRFAVERARPQFTHIDLKKVAAVWGDLELEAAGAVDIDAAGYPEGDITVRLTNWREIIALARGLEQVPAPLLDAVEAGLKLLAGLNGRAETLDVPIRFKGGTAWIGPVPIGAAPQLTLR